jgi:hypothetical protein
LIAPIVFLAMHFHPRRGIFIGFFCLILGLIGSFAPRWFGAYSWYEWREFNTIYDAERAVRWMFYLPNNHASAFMMGMLIGFVTKRHPNVYLGGKWGERVIWLVTISLSVYSLVWHNKVS